MTESESESGGEKVPGHGAAGFMNRYSQTVLFLALTALVFGWPFAQRIEPLEVLFEFLILVILLAGVPTAYRNRPLFIALCVLAAAAFGTDWLSDDQRPVLELCASLASIFFLMLLTGHVMTVVFSRSDEVTWGTILGAINGYLLLGIVFAFVYDVMDQLAPDSLQETSGFSGDLDLKVVSFLYFSFVTLTTLGYGDIVPMTPDVAVVAMLEVMTGQFYLVVMVARLVSLHVSQP
jgi:hypothetical protein